MSVYHARGDGGKRKGVYETEGAQASDRHAQKRYSGKLPKLPNFDKLCENIQRKMYEPEGAQSSARVCGKS